MSASSFSLSTACRVCWLVIGALALLATGARAFPPAPSFTIHGVARDPYGWALKAADQGIVIIKRNGSVIAEAPINETVRSGENFRALVPMDTNPADPYRTGAQTSGTLFAIEVRFPNATVPVASLTTSQRTIGQPGGLLFVDFTLGVDSDGDGIPDTWEFWQLGEAGIGTGDPRWSLTTLGTGDFDHDGTSDYVEYLAGTFAFLSSETLRLKITGWRPDGSAVLRAFVVVDKTYRVECSENLRDWTRTAVRADSAVADAAITFTATDTREMNLYSPAAIGRKKLYYRMVLVR